MNEHFAPWNIIICIMFSFKVSPNSHESYMIQTTCAYLMESCKVVLTSYYTSMSCTLSGNRTALCDDAAVTYELGGIRRTLLILS